MTKEEMDKLIEARFDKLTPKLQCAARHVLDAPNDIALHSMRAVASHAKLQPATMLRLARELGFENYGEFRSIYMDWLSGQNKTFYMRAADLRQRSAKADKQGLLSEFFLTEASNLDETFGPKNAKGFKVAQKILDESKEIYIFGQRSLFPAAYYLHYACAMFASNTTLLTGVGGTFADELRRIGKDDVLVAFSFHPYALSSIAAIEFVRQRGAKIIAITDSPVSPIATGTSVTLLTPTASPSLFPSVVPAVAVAQALAALMIASGGEERLEEIANSEAQLRHFNVLKEK
ncbi:MurR/RpiR family transcriptional regulator [Pollutimonas bauzanensis]|uniref:Transcriptional regulator, RpiR family n=1 Tax=Pollutimonas bauzanensis TaxID=658167 RepID=A0A1M5VJB2_9BURK|nr:MurR/RpiR family transcriptional regulator [Pollutimonas bauzanensis]SHH75154.1 transcriptional regulator, RpiR family [Pollutimonas bauzanensis]